MAKGILENIMVELFGFPSGFIFAALMDSICLLVSTRDLS